MGAGIRGQTFDRIGILLSALKRVDRVPTLSNKGVCPLVAFDRIGISLSAVKRADRVPTLSINSLHTYNFDRIGILSARGSIIIRIPAHAGI